MSFGGDALRSYQPGLSLIQIVDLCTRSILVTFIFVLSHLIVFMQCVNIAFQCALVSIIKRKIALISDACSRPLIIIKTYDLHADNIKRFVSDACSRPLIIIKSYDLHAGNIKRFVSEITSFPTTITRGTSSLPFYLVPVGCVSFGLSLAFSFCLP